MNMTPGLNDLSPQNSQCWSHHEKNTGQIPKEGPPPKCLTSPPQQCHGLQKQGGSDTLSQPRGAQGDREIEICSKK